MRRLVRDAKKTLPVRQTALSIVQNIPAKNWYREVSEIWQFVNNNIRYVRDVSGVETLQTPEKTMEFGQGDCDDQSVLIASLLESIGHPGIPRTHRPQKLQRSSAKRRSLSPQALLGGMSPFAKISTPPVTSSASRSSQVA